MARLTGTPQPTEIHTLLREGYKVRVIAKQLNRKTNDVVWEIYQSGLQHLIHPDDTVLQPDVFDRLMAGETLTSVAAELGCAESQVCRKFKATGFALPRRGKPLNKLRTEGICLGHLGPVVHGLHADDADHLIKEFLRSREPTMAAFLVNSFLTRDV